MTDFNEASPASDLLRVLYQRSFKHIEELALAVPQEDRMLVWEEVFSQESVAPTLALNNIWKDAKETYQGFVQDGKGLFFLPGHLRVLEDTAPAELANELLGKNFFLSFQQLLEAMEYQGNTQLTLSKEHEEKYLQFLTHRWQQNHFKNNSLFDQPPYSSTWFLDDKWEKLCTLGQNYVDEILNDPYGTYQHEDAKAFGAEVTKRLLLSQTSEGLRVKAKKM